MFKYIKDLMHPISKKCPSSKDPMSLTVYFKRPEKSSGEGDFAKKEKGHIQRCNEILTEATTRVVEKVTPYADFFLEIADPNDLKNLTDLRTCKEFQKILNTEVDNSQPLARCKEVPRQFVFRELEPESGKLSVSAEKTYNEIEEIAKILANKYQRNPIKSVNCHEQSPDECLDLQVRSESPELNNPLELDIHQAIINLLKTRDLAMERAKIERAKIERAKIERAKIERAKIERAKNNNINESKTGQVDPGNVPESEIKANNIDKTINSEEIINMDNILEFEERSRSKTWIEKNLNEYQRAREDVMNETDEKPEVMNETDEKPEVMNETDEKPEGGRSKPEEGKIKPEEYLSSNPPSKNYMSDLLKITRIIDQKIMLSKETRRTVEKPDHSFNPPTTFNMNQIEIRHVHKLKRSDTVDEHTIGMVTGNPYEDIKK